MATHIKRTKTSHHSTLSVYSGARTSTWLLPPEGYSTYEVQKHVSPGQWKDVPGNKNYLIPPYHWHWVQREEFEILRGRFIFTANGIDTIHDKNSGLIVIPPRTPHTFRTDPSCLEDCEIHIRASPASGIDEMFFRNLYSYLDDCQMQRVEPSLPQLLLFLDAAEVSLALPGPQWIMRWVSWGLGVVVGRWIGGGWFGYKGCYGEWFEEGMVKRK